MHIVYAGDDVEEGRQDEADSLLSGSDLASASSS